MQGTTHLKLGIAVGAMSGYMLPLPIPGKIALGAGCIIGSVLPDIDTKQSIASNNLKVAGFITRHTVGHRGVVHTPIFGLVISLIVTLICIPSHMPITFPIGLMSGYIIHLLQDSFTKRGIMWAFPVSKRYFAIYRIKSGKSTLVENLISTAIFLSIFLIIYGVMNVKH